MSDGQNNPNAMHELKTHKPDESAVRSIGMVRPTGPRLRCEERSSNHFYGTYKGHSVGIERDHPGARWGFRVIAKDGMRAADGVRDGNETMREVILYALTGAELWPNSVITDKKPD